MSKSSVVTVRETPVAKTTSASAGGLVVVAETIEVDTSDRVEIVDLTDTVMAFVRRSGVQEGLLSLWSMHTTCTVFINESQGALDADMKQFLEDLIRRQGQRQLREVFRLAAVLGQREFNRHFLF